MNSASGKIFFLQEDSCICLSTIEENARLIGRFFPLSEIIVVLEADCDFPAILTKLSSVRVSVVTVDRPVDIPLFPLRKSYTYSSDWILVFPLNFLLDQDWALFAKSWIQSPFSANFVRLKGFANVNIPISPHFWFFKPKECELNETCGMTEPELLDCSSVQQLSGIFRDRIYSDLIRSSHVLSHDFIFSGEERYNLLPPFLSTVEDRHSLIHMPSSWQDCHVHIPEVGDQYLMVKGAEGFADRMECLLQAIFYCCRTKRILVVDWRDPDWSHVDNDGIGNVFEVRGVKSISIEVFESYFSTNSAASVFPSAWKGRLFSKMTLAEQRDSSLCIPSSVHREGSALQDIATGNRPDFCEDIVVFNGYGTRYYFPELAASIRLSSDLVRHIEDFMNARGLQEHQYDVCHLRGGSKQWLGGSVRKDSPVWADHNQWADSYQYLDAIYNLYIENCRSASYKRLFIVSDSPCLYNLWRERYGVGDYIQVSAGDMKEACGIHKICSSTLERLEISKHTVNIEAIRDFVIMLRSRFLFGDSVSRYSLLAFRLKQAGIDFSRPVIL